MNWYRLLATLSWIAAVVFFVWVLWSREHPYWASFVALLGATILTDSVPRTRP